MSRTLKNSLSVLLLFLLVCGSVFTVCYARSNRGIDAENPRKNWEDSLPEMPNQQPEKGQDGIPEKPQEAETGAETGGISEITSDFNGMGMMQMERPNGWGNVSVVYLGLFAAISIVMSLLTMELAMSGFHKKSFAETFFHRDKVTIYVLSCILVSIVLFVLQTGMMMLR